MERLYGILGLRSTASASEVKAAYRRLALELHPDKNDGDESCATLFHAVTVAYQTIMDPEKLSAYLSGSEQPGLSRLATMEQKRAAEGVWGCVLHHLFDDEQTRRKAFAAHYLRQAADGEGNSSDAETDPPSLQSVFRSWLTEVLWLHVMSEAPRALRRLQWRDAVRMLCAAAVMVLCCWLQCCWPLG